GETTLKSPFDKFEWNPVYAALSPGEDGTFLTERIPPGTYQLQAHAFKPLTKEQMFRTGAIAPSYHAQVKIVVPAEGELKVDDLARTPIGEKQHNQDRRKKENPAADNPPEKQMKPPIRIVTVKGKVAEDATGKKVARFFTRGGKFAPADPTKVTWGTWEIRT